MSYSRVLDSMITGANYQIERLSKEISSAIAEKIDWPFKIIMKSADEKQKSTCKIKQTLKPVGP